MLQRPQIDGTPDTAILHFQQLLQFPAGISAEFAEAYRQLNPVWQNAMPQLMLELWLLCGGANADVRVVEQQLVRLAAKTLQQFEERNTWPLPPLFDLSVLQSLPDSVQIPASRSDKAPLTLQEAVASSGIRPDARLSENPKWVLYCRVLAACAAAAAAGTLVCTLSTVEAVFRQRIDAVKNIEERWLAYTNQTVEAQKIDQNTDRWQQAFLQVHSALLRKSIGPAQWFAGPGELEKFNRYFLKTYGHVEVDVARRSGREEAGVETIRLSSSGRNQRRFDPAAIRDEWLEYWHSLLQHQLPDWVSTTDGNHPEFQFAFTIGILKRIHRRSLKIDVFELVSDGALSPRVSAAAVPLAHCLPGLLTLAAWCESSPWRHWQPPADWDTFTQSLRLLPADSLRSLQKACNILQPTADLLVELRLFQILLVLRLQGREWQEIHALLKDEPEPPAALCDHWCLIAEHYKELAFPVDVLPLRALADIVGGKWPNLRDWYDRRTEDYLLPCPAR